MAYEIRPNSICNLPGYQRTDSYFARAFRGLDGFNSAMTVQEFRSQFFPQPETVLTPEVLFEDISPPVSPEIPQPPVGVDSIVVEMTGGNFRSGLPENAPAALFRTHPRDDLVARLLVPQIIEGRQDRLLPTPEPMEVEEDEHPFEDEAYFEELFADISND